MDDSIHSALAAWGNFYLITGGAAATLTGLQFVVQSLFAADLRPALGSNDPEAGIAAFGTPTVVHLSISLLVSAILCAPWSGYGSLRTTLGLLSAGALVYSAIVVRRARRQRAYEATLYDWVWHVILPTLAYVAFGITATIVHRGAEWALDLAAFATLLLLCVGIHNAWDNVTYLTITALRAVKSNADH